MTSFPALRIALLGAGNIGSAFAFQLARVGHHNVTVVTRPNSLRFEQLQRDGGIVNIRGERAETALTNQFDERIAYDLVVVTVLAHQVDVLIPVLKRSAAKCFLFMFNNFDPVRLRDQLGAERCEFGMPFIQASLGQDGKLKASIGAGGQKTKLSDQRWVDLFNAAGLPAKFEPKMMLWLRCHAPLCVGFESISVAGVRRGGGASWAQAMVTARGVQAGFALIKASGDPLYPAGKAWLNASPNWLIAIMFWSLSRITSFRELLAGGIAECRALVDTMVAAAPQANPAVEVAAIQAMRPSEESH
jgi:2-dehydropantoate 2-reductase